MRLNEDLCCNKNITFLASRYVVFPKWSARYREFRRLITSLYITLALPEQPAFVSNRPKSGKYVRKVVPFHWAIYL
ncbi:hypothetical protein EON65_32540 [archaeon]|nr:MAG: hypothetical protein EON65_32540 [archaeon]